MLSEYELLQVRSFTGLWSVSQWRSIYHLMLGRKVTEDEVLDAHRRLNGPTEPGSTYGEQERNTESWWRKPL